ncbi:hypothetical protein T484DRAFT_1979506 [Baffinella frigidus]|nr:hypothetical protein T484DRAFT_1983851 [Cryptophyta sp. CCMP2293]KAJ1470681.1 hypothetical protein T484DRAFT_1979506 [Cryptophyta sp. CCMP2293]
MNPPQPVLASGAVGTAVLGWLAALSPSSKIPCQNPPRGTTGRWRGAGRAVPGTHTSFVRFHHGQSGAWAGSAPLVGAI